MSSSCNAEKTRSISSDVLGYCQGDEKITPPHFLEEGLNVNGRIFEDSGGTLKNYDPELWKTMILSKSCLSKIMYLLMGGKQCKLLKKKVITFCVF